MYTAPKTKSIDEMHDQVSRIIELAYNGKNASDSQRRADLAIDISHRYACHIWNFYNRRPGVPLVHCDKIPQRIPRIVYAGWLVNSPHLHGYFYCDPNN